MRTKKFLSVIAALALLAQSAISAPLALAEGETKIGLVYSNDGTAGWEEGYDFKENTAQTVDISYLTDGDRTYMHFVPGGSVDNTSSYLASPMAFASLGTDKIKIEEGKTIVTEMVVRVNADADATSGRPRIGYSFPEDSSLQNFTYINTAPSTENNNNNKGTTYRTSYCSESMYEFLQKDVRFGEGGYPGGITNTDVVDSTHWYKLVSKLNGDYSVSYTVTDLTTGTTVKTYTPSKVHYVQPKSGYFENIAIYTWMHGKSLSGAFTDVDYVKVYNVPEAEADNYTAATWQTAFDEIAISDVKVDGVAITDGFEATNGTVTFTASSAVTVKEVSYDKGDGKVTLEEDDYTFTNNNTVTFTDALESSATYTVLLDLGYTTYPITFNSAYIAKLGLVYSTEGNATDWTIPTGINSGIATSVNYTAGAPDYVTFTATGNGGGGLEDYSPYILASLGADKIKFEDDKTIVIESKIKFTGLEESTNRVKFGYNLPASGITSHKVYLNGVETDYRGNMGDTHLLEFIDEANKYTYTRYGTGNYWGLAGNWTASATEPVDGQWFKVVMKMNPGFVMDYALYDQDGNLLFEKNSQTMQYTTMSDYFENVALIMTHNTFSATTDVDYVKVFNVPTAEKNNYATYGVFSDIKLNGAAISGTPEIAEGATTVTFNSTQDDITVKIVKENIKTTEKATVNEYTFTNNAGVAAKSVAFTSERGYKYNVSLGVNGGETAVSFTTPWVNQTGLLIDEDGTGSETWTTSSGANFAPVEGEGYLRLAEAANGAYASITLPEPIQLQDDNEVVIDARFRGDKIVNNGDPKGRIQLLINRPETTKMAYNQTGYPDRVVGAEGETMTSYETAYATGANHLALVDVLEDSALRFAGENWKDGNWSQNNWVDKYTVTELDNVWYRVVVRISKDYWTEYTLYDANDNKLGSWAAYQAWTSKECGNFIKSIQFQNFCWNGLNADLDYLKVYNIEKDSDDAVLTSNNNTATLTIETPATAEAIGATLYVASYVGGQLKAVDMATVTGATTTVTVPEIAGATYKTFLWDGNMKPVAHK